MKKSAVKKSCCCSTFPLLTATMLVALSPSSAWAIPSPDLVVNMFGSAAQLLALSSVFAGAGFMKFRKQGRPGENGTAWQRLFYCAAVLLLISFAINVLQHTYWQDNKAKRLRTNLWRSSKENGQKVGDASLKTLAFSDQLRHPDGISTETLARWLADGKPVNIIDVRETEEYEAGHVVGARQSRYPDTRLDFDRLFTPDAENILMCYSGNRSSELSSEIRASGGACRFVIGGYEKWIAEGRPLSGSTEAGRDTLRGLPDYPHSETLLDTPDVLPLMQQENALFVDVRYPGDFALDHLPGAVNIPVRKLTGAELESALASLPDRPIIAPCYDKRSCFYAEVLGLKLSRLGYDFRGRYTVPHEYAVPAMEKKHVAQWKQQQKSRTVFYFAAAPLAGLLRWLAGDFGLAPAIIILTVLLRLLVLPISVKADRDTVVQRRIKPAVDSLKQQWAENGRRLSAEIKALYREQRLTPGLNFLGTSFQLVLFVICFSAVNMVARENSSSFLWSALAKPDPYLILPLMVSGLFFVHLYFSTARRSALSVLLFLGIAGGLFAMTAPISAGVNLYLTCSLGFLVLQNRLTAYVLDRPAKQPAPLADLSGVVMLKDAHRAAGAGNKAKRLAEMLCAGLPVPDGFVVTDTMLCKTHGSEQFNPDEDDRAVIMAAFTRLEAEVVAVRSSGLSEDGAEQSYAGVFESLLNVERDRLVQALQTVSGSFCSLRAESYSGNNGREQGGIVVQKMVAAEYAGVLFTEHPASAGCMLVELVSGLGEKLVSGTATPHSFRFGRASGRLMEEDPPPVDLEPLIALGRQAEELFGRPQDIEWAFYQGKFYLLQARDITAPVTARLTSRGILERERQRVLDALAAGRNLPPTGTLQQNELTELLPSPTPFSMSFMEALWDEGGTTDIACRRLGIPYAVDRESAPYVVSVFGSLYVNQAEGRRRLAKGPDAVTSFRLARAADAIERSYFDDFLPAFDRSMRLRDAVDFARLNTGELVALFTDWAKEFITETYVHAEMINIAADQYMKAAKRLLARKGHDPARYLSHGPETVTSRAMALLPAIRQGTGTVDEFLDLYGHRAVHDYEFAAPRYGESPQLVEQLLSRAGAAPPAARANCPEPFTGRLLELSVQRARRFQCLKEDAKHYSMRALGAIRRLLLELDQRLALEGRIFYLTVSEIAAMNETPPKQLARTAAERCSAFKIYKRLKLPTELSVEQLERLEFDEAGQTLAPVRHGGALQGTYVSGDKEVVSKVRVIDSPEQFSEFQEGEIIVARFTDPSWVPLFPKAAGLVTEVGGWLSHSTIVAREYGLPCIVGAPGVMAQLRTGQRVRLCSDGMIDRRVSGADRRRQHMTVMVDRRLGDRRGGDQRRGERRAGDRRKADRRREANASAA